MIIGWLALSGRIILVGAERVFVKKLKHYSSTVVTFWWFFITGLFYVPFVVYVGVDDFSFVPYAIASSVFYLFGAVAYTKAVQIADISFVAPFYNFNSLFLLLLTVVFLGEPFTLLKLFGILLLIFGASFLSAKKGLINSYKELLGNKAVVYMLVFGFCYAFARTIDGYAIRSASTVVYALSLEVLLAVYLFAYNVLAGKFGEMKKMISESPKWTIVLGAQNAFSFLFLLIAFTQIQVSVAEPLTMLSVFITIILGKILFKEKVAGRLIGAILMAAGAVLLIFKF